MTWLDPFVGMVTVVPEELVDHIPWGFDGIAPMPNVCPWLAALLMVVAAQAE